MYFVKIKEKHFILQVMLFTKISYLITRIYSLCVVPYLGEENGDDEIVDEEGL
jgi:hypothetical protein